MKELAKAIMFTVIWSMPVAVTYILNKPKFLALFIVSFFVTLTVFSHYEDLEKLEHIRKVEKENE